MAYTPNSWSIGDKITKIKLDRLESGAAVASGLAEAASAGVYYVDQNGLKGDWVGADASGIGTNDTAAFQALLNAVPDRSTILFNPLKTYRIDPVTAPAGRTYDVNGRECRVVTKTMEGSDFGLANPFISWSSEFGPEINLASAGFARGATGVVTNPFGSSSGLAAGDLVLIYDHWPHKKWDTGASVSWVGHGEVNIVRSVVSSTGTVQLQIPLSHDYLSNGGDVPKIRKITKSAQPRVRNFRISDTNPGGPFTGDVEEGGAHLFYFYGCVDPTVENIRVDGWQNYITNFNKCLRPKTDDIEGMNPFQVGSGHGYLGRMIHCVDGEFRRHVGYGARHVVNYVGAARCGSRECFSYRPAGVSFQTHGLDSRDIYSIDDTVVGGDASGWSHGNPQYGFDVGYRVENGRYYGNNKGMLARSGSKGMHIVNPEIHSPMTNIEISALADDVVIDLTQATLEVFGSAPSAYAVRAADVDGSGEYKPVSVLVLGPGKLIGARAVVSMDVTGSGQVSGFRYGLGDGSAKMWDGTNWKAISAAPASAASADLGTVLSDQGLRLAGAAYPITTSGAAAFTGGFRTGASVRTASLALTTATAPTNLCNATTAPIVMTLPNTGTAGHRFLIKKTDASANTVTLAAGSGGSIDGAASVILDAQYKWVEVVSSTTVGAWYIVARG